MRCYGVDAYLNSLSDLENLFKTVDKFCWTQVEVSVCAFVGPFVVCGVYELVYIVVLYKLML